MLKSKELRAKAWDSLKGKYWRAVLVVIVLIGIFNTFLKRENKEETEVNLIGKSIEEVVSYITNFEAMLNEEEYEAYITIFNVRENVNVEIRAIRKFKIDYGFYPGVYLDFEQLRPSILRAETILPVTMVPISLPNSSPRATRTAGAV